MMKQFTFLILVLAVSLSNCFAQKVQNRSLLSVSVGPSFPIGDFASTNTQSKYSGYAIPGEEVNLSYVYKCSPKFGLIAALFGQRNGLNIKSMKQQLSEFKFIKPGGTVYTGNMNNPPPPDPSPSYVYYTNWHFEKHDWLSASLLLGGMGVFPAGVGRKLSVVVKGMAGLIYVSSPEMKATSITDTTLIAISQTSESGWGFSYMAYAGLQYRINPHMLLLFGINYLGTARIKFSEITADTIQFYHSNWGTGLLSLTEMERAIKGSRKQVVQTMGLNVGIAWEL